MHFQVSAQLALVDAYLAVMHKVTLEGFAFIERELADFWDLPMSDEAYYDPMRMLELGLENSLANLSPAEQVIYLRARSFFLFFFLLLFSISLFLSFPTYILIYLGAFIGIECI